MPGRTGSTMVAEGKIVGVAPGEDAAPARRIATGRPVAMLARSKERAEFPAAGVAGARGYACEVGEAGAPLFNAGSGVCADMEHITSEPPRRAWSFGEPW